jgi:ribonuclease HI
MELTAVVESLKVLKTKCVVEFFTDSKYVIDGITKWCFGWQKNNWKTADKKDVKNKELWQSLIEESSKHEGMK